MPDQPQPSELDQIIAAYSQPPWQRPADWQYPADFLWPPDWQYAPDWQLPTEWAWATL